MTDLSYSDPFSVYTNSFPRQYKIDLPVDVLQPLHDTTREVVISEKGDSLEMQTRFYLRIKSCDEDSGRSKNSMKREALHVEF